MEIEAIQGGGKVEGSILGAHGKKLKKAWRIPLSLQLATLESTARLEFICGGSQRGKSFPTNQRFSVHVGHTGRIHTPPNDRQKALVLRHGNKSSEAREVSSKKIKDLYANPEAESHDDSFFKDGRVFGALLNVHRKSGTKSWAVSGRFSGCDRREKRAEQSLIRKRNLPIPRFGRDFARFDLVGRCGRDGGPS
jgi:hypothetical protein